MISRLSGGEQPTVRTFDQRRIRIGRDPSSNLVLDDGKYVVSKQHAELQCDEDVRVVDVGSKNATFLNGNRLPANSPTLLRTGDIVRIGDFTLELLPALATEGRTEPEAHPPSVDQTIMRHFGSLTERPSPERASGQTEELKRAIQELMFLNELSREIGAAMDSNAVLEQIVSYAVRATRASQGLITLSGHADDRMETLVRQRDDSDVLFHVNQSLFAWMHERKEPVRMDEDSGSRSNAGLFGVPGPRSLLCVPLLVRGRLIGILSVCSKRDATGFTDDDERLLMIMAGQSAQVIETTRLHEEEQRLQRMREELRTAFEIQTQLLPKSAPQFDGYELAGRSLPAQTVGGDYFDYIGVDESRLSFCVADVSGKGLPAALLMSNVQATIRALSLSDSPVSGTLATANDLLYRSTGRGAFVTLWYGRIDRRTHRLRYANAGHNRPLLVRRDGSAAELQTAGLVLGFQPQWTYEEAEVLLSPGDLLAIYSDGVTEAMSPSREQYGEERFTALLRRYHDESAANLADLVFEDVSRYTEGSEQSDDMTLLLIKRR